MAKVCSTDEITIKGVEGEVLVLHLTGVVKPGDVAQVRLKTDKLLALKPGKEFKTKVVIVDMSEAKSLDSSVFLVLMGYAKTAVREGDIVVFVATGEVRDFMRATRMDHSLTVVKNMEDAKKHLVMTA